MRKRWIIGFAAVGALAALASGSASAVSDRGRANKHAADVALERSAGEMSSQDAAHHQASQAQGSGDDDGAAALAELIADAFDVDADDVMELHEDGIGFGALFKLYAIAEAQDTTIDELMDSITTEPGDGPSFAFGQLRKSLSESELEELQDGPTNLGQLVSASRRSDHTHGP